MTCSNFTGSQTRITVITIIYLQTALEVQYCNYGSFLSNSRSLLSVIIKGVYFYPCFLKRKVLCNHVVHAHLFVCQSVNLPNSFQARYPLSTKSQSTAEDSKLLSYHKLHENKLLHIAYCILNWKFHISGPLSERSQSQYKKSV